jgi:hypothetical protein
MKMCRPLKYIAILAPAFFAIACSEKAETPPTGPDLHTVLNKSSGCDLQHISQLANSYFSPPRQQAVKDLVGALSATPLYTVEAKGWGFDIMAQMDGALNTDVPATAGVPSVGSDLINHLLLCMYDPNAEAASYPVSFPDTFTVALTPSLTGAFGHRTSGAAPVYARTSAAPPAVGFSGIAPTPSSTWGVTNSPARVVLYGRPATTTSTTGVTTFDSQTYDWRTIPHNATFSPGIVVAICVDAVTDTTTMVNEQGVAILSFVDAGFLDPASCSPTTTALLGSSSPFQLAGRLVRFGADLFGPRPLMAAVLSPGGVGGSSSKCCSKVGPSTVPSVSLTLSNVTTPVKVNTGRFSLTATTKFGTVPVNGVGITLSTTTNSGTPTSIRVAPVGSPCTSGDPPVGITGTGANAAGTYLFTNLCFTNTGNVFISAKADVTGRNDAPVTTISNKINVKP